MFFAHFIGDYVLQIRWLAETKGKEWYNMLVHCVLYSSSVGLVPLLHSHRFPLLGLIVIFVSHWLIDSWKVRMNSIAVSEQDKKANLYMDQLMHFMLLIAIIIWYK